MNNPQQARLERVFETLRNQNITPTLGIEGASQLREDDTWDFADRAAAAGTPGRWVGDHVGQQNHGGGYWDAGILRYHYSGLPVQRLLFWCSQTECAQALVEALDQQGFRVIWPGTANHFVEVDLLHGLLQARQSEVAR